MLDYNKAYAVIEKKLSDCWAMPYSDENYKKIEKYIETLYYLKALCHEMPEAESTMTAEPITMTDTAGKSEFEKTVWGIIKSKPGKETIACLIKEIDKFVEMQRLLHPGRYGEFISKLKEMK